MPIEFVGGEVKLKDQLREYSDRGDALENLSFMDFFSETYDGDYPKGTGRSQHVPYKEGTGHGKRCRVIRRRGHETIVQFVGTWFPRRDRPDRHEYYCAFMLALLKLWRSMKDLKSDREYFADAWRTFSMNLTAKQIDIVDNIQYFHEASDHAHTSKRSTVDGALLNITGDPLPEQCEQDAHQSHSTSIQPRVYRGRHRIAEASRHPFREVQLDSMPWTRQSSHISKSL